MKIFGHILRENSILTIVGNPFEHDETLSSEEKRRAKKRIARAKIRASHFRESSIIIQSDYSEFVCAWNVILHIEYAPERKNFSSYIPVKPRHWMAKSTKRCTEKGAARMAAFTWSWASRASSIEFLTRASWCRHFLIERHC